MEREGATEGQRMSREDRSEKDQAWLRAWALELDVLGFESWFYLFLAVHPWTSCLTFRGLGLNFKMGITMFTSQSCSKG